MDWGACLIPKGPNGTGYSSFSGGDSIGITSQCKDPEAAWDFIEYALSEDVQVEELAKGGKVQLVGFGNFEVSERPAREGRNPRTGETMTIAASKTPKFKPGKALKDEINK